MGYYSDITIAVAFASKADMDEVLAVYAMLPEVQEYKLLDEYWERREDNIMLYTHDSVKWYASFEDVQAVERLKSLVEEFHEARGMPFAWHKIRIGEDENDLEIDEAHGGDEGKLIEKLWEGMRLVRYTEVQFA